MDEKFHNLKIFFAICLSIATVLVINGSLKFDFSWFNNIIHPQRTISSIKIDYNKILTDINPNESFVMSEVKFAPVVTISLPSPTLKPPTPTMIKESIIKKYPTTVVAAKKIISPTVYIAPTSIPATPTQKPKQIGEMPLSDPLKQPYYGRASSICYTPEYFIKFYGGNLTPDKCYSNIKAYVEANLVSVNILGRSLGVHKLAAPYFKAVGEELARYQKDSNTFIFPSKTYKINTIGAYAFRCNVNASTGDSWDTCQSGCVIGTHAFGIAIDINWEENCNGCSTYDMPPEIVAAFEKYGFRWGGRYKDLFGARIDPMHFEYMYDLCKDLK